MPGRSVGAGQRSDAAIVADAAPVTLSIWRRVSSSMVPPFRLAERGAAM